MRFVTTNELREQPAGAVFYQLIESPEGLALDGPYVLVAIVEHTGVFCVKYLLPQLEDQVRPFVRFRDYSVRWEVSPAARFMLLEAEDRARMIRQLAELPFGPGQESVKVPTVGELYDPRTGVTPHPDA